MRGDPKDGYTLLRSNKHCKQRMVRILLDSGSDGDHIIVHKDTASLLKQAGSTVMMYSEWNLSDAA